MGADTRHFVVVLDKLLTGEMVCKILDGNISQTPAKVVIELFVGKELLKIKTISIAVSYTHLTLPTIYSV